MPPVLDSTASLELLSELLFAHATTSETAQQRRASSSFVAPYPERTIREVTSLAPQDLGELKRFAASNHVIVRCFEAMQEILVTEGKWSSADWISKELRRESARIQHALQFLEQICYVLEEHDCEAIVMKSLDHWPDLGSDLDLYVEAEPATLVEVMRTRFHATLADRSWGDRLANKWNFIVPGLPELVEVHAGRLGQTGEQTAVTRSLSARAQLTEIGGHTFRVPAPEDRIIISTLQRMYRHFYIRVCDLADNAKLVDSRLVNFGYLHDLASAAGLWDGVATYLAIISEYVEAFRGYGIPLPALVIGTAKFGSGEVRFRNNFLRVPILPHSVNLFATELKSLLLRGDLRNSLRLSLLPGLATAAALEYKFTGSDKGIW